MTTISHQKEESGPQPEVGGQGRAKAYLGELLRPEVEGVGMPKFHRRATRALEFGNHEAFIRRVIKKIPAEASKLGKRHPDSERGRCGFVLPTNAAGCVL